VRITLRIRRWRRGGDVQDEEMRAIKRRRLGNPDEEA
jgi:hypothetical protein